MAIATLNNIDSLENYFNQSKDTGVPRDQVELFIKAGYVALPKALEFHAAAREADKDYGPTEIAQGGARGPGKSHSTLAQIGLDDCQRYPGLKFLFLRKLAKSATESFEDLILKIFQYTEHLYIPSRNRLEFPNGSVIVLGGFQNESDIDKYLGIEYDGIGLEEATQLSERKYLMIKGSLRSTKPGWRERIYLTTNPGNIGHGWFKNRFVVPQRQGKETSTRFIPSNYKDNPFLSKGYVEYLETLPGALGRAWRDGDWDTFEGMAFPQWDHDRHTSEPFQIPQHWPKWRAADWGYSAPFAAYWFARDTDTQRIYVYREVYGTQLTDLQQARLIREMTPGDEIIRTTYLDPAMWTRNRQTENVVYSTADTYQAEGIMVTKADNDRLSGKRKFDRLLADLPDGKPGMIIFRNCLNAIRTIPELIYDDIHPEDVDTKMEDHAYDAIRYGLTDTRDMKAREERKNNNPFVGMKGL